MKILTCPKVSTQLKPPPSLHLLNLKHFNTKVQQRTSQSIEGGQPPCLLRQLCILFPCMRKDKKTSTERIAERRLLQQSFGYERSPPDQCSEVAPGIWDTRFRNSSGHMASYAGIGN